MNNIVMRVKKLHQTAKTPCYAKEFDAGMDLASVTDATIRPFERMAIPTGLAIELPAGYEAQVRPRSGLAINQGVTVLNTPGTIDAGYRGEIKVILINLGNEDFTISVGDRVAQLVIKPIEYVRIEEVEILSESVRGNRGFGSSGTTN